jgi:D-alanyl-D-alanine carboxypeptidase
MSLDCTSVRSPLKRRISAVSRVFGFAMALFVVSLSIDSTAYAKYASFVIDADTGEVLHGTNQDTRNYPASLTKMMTLYLIFERLEDKRWTIKTPLKVSRRAAAQPASKLGLKAGSTITVKQAILALAVKSANDVATTVAENISGKERSFALKMTAKARSIGMKKTTFRNASGLPHRGQLSTARDMSVLARALLRDFPQHYHYFATKSFRWNGRTYRSHNKLLKTYPGSDGFKTGYIRASGFNLVSSATRDGRRIIGVVFGGRSSKQRNAHMAKLLDKGFARLTGNRAPARIASKPAAPKTKKLIASNSKTSWAVQVGAFSRKNQAQAAAAQAVGKASKYLAHGQVKIVPLKKRSGKILHRARIVGITKREAYRSCRVLRDCMELRTKYGPELASTHN